ncbi:uncharacterized protein MCYG_08620 [Microsporum canis CBS 113480]|uniref:Uncharacterized protein n=1 Tax=Arthroderma otae (strain ATCC MYA-4605 / CBS 113480) TaxID=554155 RepID=C5G0Z8_ARTOC|nr:uncharacterized protein MCYG_08620 [Microsporum canis CBS 113480]EEQ35801.1 predicted protein [Microsporum canis CBS 113480]
METSGEKARRPEIARVFQTCKGWSFEWSWASRGEACNQDNCVTRLGSTKLPSAVEPVAQKAYVQEIGKRWLVDQSKEEDKKGGTEKHCSIERLYIISCMLNSLMRISLVWPCLGRLLHPHSIRKNNQERDSTAELYLCTLYILCIS